MRGGYKWTSACDEIACDDRQHCTSELQRKVGLRHVPNPDQPLHQVQHQLNPRLAAPKELHEEHQVHEESRVAQRSSNLADEIYESLQSCSEHFVMTQI